MELQWCMTLDDCTLMPLIVIVKLVALEGELKIGNYVIIVYTGGMYVCRVLTGNLIPNGA